MKNFIRRLASIFLKVFYPKLYFIESKKADLGANVLNIIESKISSKSNVGGPGTIYNSEINDYTYVSMNCLIHNTKIGKFCSIGPNLFCGWGIHPTNGISTSPAFYSTGNQAKITFSKVNKIKETLPIEIGNDVLIGMNVTILDGVKIGNGAIIGAGAVVSKDIPPYAIAVGSPIKISRYRFSEEEIESLLKIKWWDFTQEHLADVEKHFYNIKEFISLYGKKD